MSDKLGLSTSIEDQMSGLFATEPDDFYSVRRVFVRSDVTTPCAGKKQARRAEIKIRIAVPAYDLKSNWLMP
jgi:hypothetical protein